MGKVSLALQGSKFVDFVQKNKKTFHEVKSGGKMRLIQRDRRWYLEDANKKPLAFSKLDEDLSSRKVTWNVKAKGSDDFSEAKIEIKSCDHKVRKFGKSMKQELKKKHPPTTEPRSRNVKRSLSELDATSSENQLFQKRRKANKDDQFTSFTAFKEKYEDDECYMMRLQDDMYKESKKTESLRQKSPNDFYPQPNYLSKQPYDETNRLNALMDVVQLCFKLKVQKHTLHLAVRLFDRYASTYLLKDSVLKVLPWAAFSIAVKYIEVETISMGAYANWGVKEEYIIHLERQLFQAVSLRVDDLLPYHFAERFFLLIVSEMDKNKPNAKQTGEKFHAMLWYLLDLAILDYNLLKFAAHPSLIAAACVFVACDMTQELKWAKNHDKILDNLGCSLREVNPIAKELRLTLAKGELARKSGLSESYASAEKFRISVRLEKHFKESERRKLEKLQQSQQSDVSIQSDRDISSSEVSSA